MGNTGIDRIVRALGLGAASAADKASSGPFKVKDVPSLAQYIKSDACKNIYLMLGAGISTSAGIPDFRSPETGLYANLERLSLPYPQAVFDIAFFRTNPRPFYTLAKELYPGKYRPTPTHSFIKVLSDKGLLGICFTQNIDTLERRAGIPDEKLIEAHGSFATQGCIECKEPFSDSEMKVIVDEERIPRCKKCNGLVKPEIVFFGEDLPPIFDNNIGRLKEADLLIVIGTSLTVKPFSTLVDMVTDQCPRVLINLVEVEGMGSGKNDLVLLGKCDEIIRDLAKELGWEDELDKEWAATAATLGVHKLPPSASTKAKDSSADESNLDGELEKIVDKVAGGLTISDNDEAGVKADESTSEDAKAEEGTAQPNTPQKDSEEGERSSEPLVEVKDGQ